MPQLDLGKVVGDTGPQGLPGSPGEKGETGDTGPGVAAGGATNQVLVKHSGTNYDTQWVNAGDLPSNVALQDAMAIVANGNTHAAIANGQFVYVRNHSSLAEGMYKATAAIETNGALSTSNLTADDSGGLNDLQAQVATLNSKIGTLVKKYRIVTTTDADGDAQALDDVRQKVILSVIPIRNAGDGTYNNWFGVIIGGSSSGIALSVKCVTDNNAKLASTKVAMDVYYIEQTFS